MYKDKDFELDLTKKDVLLIHEKCNSPENGSGLGAIPSKDGQGLNQLERRLLNPVWKKTSPTFSEQSQKQASKQEQKIFQNRVRNKLQNRSRNASRTDSRIGSIIHPRADSLGGEQGLH